MRFLRILWRGWMAFARVLGRVNTTIVLSIIYFLMVPLFALWRLGDPLRLKLSRGDQTRSYWIERTPSREPGGIDRFLLPR